MAQIFRIAKSSKLSDYNVIGEKSKVSKEIFWQMVEDKVKFLTDRQPEKFEETMKTVKDHLLKGKYKSSKNSLTIQDTWFEVSGLPDA